MEQHRNQLFNSIEDESQRINAILNDRIKQNTNKVAEEQKLSRQANKHNPHNRDMEDINDTYDPNA